MRHKLAAALWTDEPAPLYLPDDPTRYLLAIVSGSTDLDEDHGRLPDNYRRADFPYRRTDYYGQRRRMEVSARHLTLTLVATDPLT